MDLDSGLRMLKAGTVEEGGRLLQMTERLWVIGSTASQAEGNGNGQRRWGKADEERQSEESPSTSASEAASHQPQ